jgi:hypothetical protein
MTQEREEQMEIKKDEIRGVQVGQELACTACVTSEEFDAATADDFLTDGDVDDKDEIYCCDRCKKQL